MADDEKMDMRDNEYLLDDRWALLVNTLRPRQNGRHFPDDIFKGIFVN